MGSEAIEQAASGYYLYCVIRADSDRVFEVASIDGDDTPVTTLRFMNLAAVVSPSGNTRYEVTRQHTLAHQLVVEHVMREFTPLPVRFGTVASSGEGIVDKLLKRRFGELQGLLNELGGTVELGVKAMWKRDALFDQILTDFPVIKRLRDSMMTKSEAETHYERIQLGKMVEEAIAAKREQEADALLDALRPLSLKTKVSKPIMDSMLLNAAFLVRSGEQGVFDAKVSELDALYSGQLTFKYVGPLPAYNFVNLVVQWD